MGQASGIVPKSGFFPPIGKPSFSHNSNVGFPYRWNWTSDASLGTQPSGSYYPSFGHNLGGFNPFGGPSMGGNGGPFEPPPSREGPNPQMQGGNNVPFNQPPIGHGYTPYPSNQGGPMVPIGNPYHMGGYQSMPHSYLASYSYPPNQ